MDFRDRGALSPVPLMRATKAAASGLVVELPVRERRGGLRNKQRNAGNVIHFSGQTGAAAL